jgi:hypothetical protein
MEIVPKTPSTVPHWKLIKGSRWVIHRNEVQLSDLIPDCNLRERDHGTTTPEDLAHR